MFGELDGNARFIEKECGVRISQGDGFIEIHGEEQGADMAIRLIRTLGERAMRG